MFARLLREKGGPRGDLRVWGEPSGCVSLAAILSNKIDVKGKNVLVTISGGNVDADSFDKYIDSV